LKVLFDTNVILDVLLDREPYSETAVRLFNKVETRKIKGYLCASTVTTLFYLVSKIIGAEKGQKEIRKLLNLFEVTPVNRMVLENALSSRFNDYEDAVLYEAARAIKVNTIVTRNVKDFKKAKIHICTPSELDAIQHT